MSYTYSLGILIRHTLKKYMSYYYAFLEVDKFDEVKGIFEYYNKIDNATYGDYDFSGYRVSKTLETTRSITIEKKYIFKHSN